MDQCKLAGCVVKLQGVTCTMLTPVIIISSIAPFTKLFSVLRVESKYQCCTGMVLFLINLIAFLPSHV